MISSRLYPKSVYSLFLLVAIGAFISSTQAATFTVSKTADTNDNVCDADCSLREAISAANAAATDDVIEFNSVVFNTGQTITLNGTQLQVNKNGTLTINGSGSNLLTISGNQASNVFRIEPDATAAITGLTIANGKLTGFGNGAGIINQLGNLTVRNSVITGNATGTDGEGGGIYSCGGNVTVNNSTISNNSAGTNGGGGIASGDSCVSGRASSLTINDSVISNNTTTSNGGGIKGGLVLNITNTVINNNSANFGGGIITGSATNLTSVRLLNNTATQGGGGILSNGRTGIVDSTVSGNRAGTDGGGIRTSDGAVLTINNTTISGNTADAGGATNFGGGGGIKNNRATVNLSASTITGNAAINGGAIFNDSLSNVFTLNGATLSSNSATKDGGGIFNNGGILTLNNSAVINNNAAASGSEGGGGIYNSVATLNVNNTTLSGNATNNQGGGIFNRGTINFSSATISNNRSANAGGGIFNFDFRTVNARNTIVGDNISNSGAAPDFRGTLASQGYNLIENTNATTITGTTAGNILGQDPQLVPLRNNGGATQTVALQPTSPAIDAGDPNNFPAADQRGISRPQDGDLNGTALPDIGAYERQVTTFTVTKTADTDDGACDADCSLREAVAATNAAATPDNAVVFASSVFNTAQTLTLTKGQLSINKNGTLIINGTGASSLTISGGNQSRVFFANTGAVAAINGVTITDGREDTGSGGGILNEGATLSLTNVFVRNNSSSDGGGIKNNNGTLNIVNSTVKDNSGRTGGGGISNSGLAGFLTISNSTVSGNLTANSGGGIINNFSAVTINNSIISDNQATSGSGGGIFIGSGGLTVTGSIFRNNSASDSGGAIRVSSSDNPVQITNSTLINNKATNGGGIRSGAATIIFTNSSITGNTATFRGGGILNDGSTVTLTASTVNNNTATNAGGGIANFGALTVANSTVSSNSSSDAGGGIFNGNGPVSLNYSTVSHNSANTGGGIYGSVNSRNSIIAENTAIGSAPDYSGTLNSQGYNLVQNISGTTITGTTTGNIIGKAPLLGALADNGGPTLTRALLPGSPAIDAGDPSNILPTDQRGFSRPRDGDGDNVARTDIGAFEVRAILVANSNSTGTGSLRQAIADVTTQGDAVVFNANVFNVPQIITLTDGEIVIPADANVAISGRGADKLTISGNNQSRIFSINTGANVTINGVTITGGNGTGSINSGHDGGISNFGSLTLSNSIVSGNSANGNGGGIGNNLNGVLTVTNSTIKNNSTATIAGGGIFNQSGQVTFTNSTINNNSAAGIGGGIANVSGTLTMTNSTISGNTAGNGGGGISNFTAGSMLTINNSTVNGNITNNNSGGGINNRTDGTVSARSTIIANNIASGSNEVDFSGTLISQGYNLIEITNGTTITGATTGNIFGQDPQLLPLGDYGGLTQTHALRLNSPAIDKGNSSGTTTDQREFPRPFDFPSVPNATGGDGSDIGAFERQATDVDRNTMFDFDGDGRADVSVFRPSDGAWFIMNSTTGFYAIQFGAPGDKLVPADYDGDGKTDVAVYRNGNWILQRSRDGFASLDFGSPGDIPVPADYDGDGKAEIAVYRPSSGDWLTLNLVNNAFLSTQFGAPEDKPVTADYDGDGKSDYAVYRPSNGAWYMMNSKEKFYAIQFGAPTDKPVPGDYDGDGRTDVAVYRASEGYWYIFGSKDGLSSAQFGDPTDIPVPADYDRDGKTDIAVYRPEGGNWYMQNSTEGFGAVQFGVPTDKPVPNAFVP